MTRTFAQDPARQQSSGYTVSQPHEPAERQAHRAADVVARGGSVAAWSFGSVPPSAPVHREESGKPPEAKGDKKDDKKEYQEAATTTLKAVLETDAGKKAKELVLATPLVKTTTDFFTTPIGLGTGGLLLGGALGGLAAAKQPLPFQLPAVPLEKIHPSLSGITGQVIIEGPVNAPTYVGLTLTFGGGSSTGTFGKEGQRPVQREPAETAAPPDLDTSGVAGVERSSGSPLEPSVRRTMEARFGYDFRGVRIHDDARGASAARGVAARAFTVGPHIGFAPGEFSPTTADGFRLLAHELAHVVQQESPRRIHRQPAPATEDKKKAEQGKAVDAVIKEFESVAATNQKLAEDVKAKPAETPKPTPGETAPATAGPGLTQARLGEQLEQLAARYDRARKIITDDLAGDAARSTRLKEAFVKAADASRAAAADAGRVNIVLIAAPKDTTDAFITNATKYADLYMQTVAKGDIVKQIAGFDSPESLMDTIEKTEPARMIRRIDIFCHGTIEPAHQIKFGAKWFRVDAVEAAAAKRADAAQTLATRTRFDGSTTIELHACRLGAPTSDPGTSGEATTTGTDFLTGFGASIGGRRGQEVVGYEQRWVPRRFELGGIKSTKELKGRQNKAFDDIAVKIWDAAMAGGTEAQSQLTDAERGGATVTRDRKIQIMRQLFDAAGGAWLIGHQYSGANPQSTDPEKDVKTSRDTFSNEADWTKRVLKVRVTP